MGLGDRVIQSTCIFGGNLCFRSMRSHREVGRNLEMREKVENYGREVWQGVTLAMDNRLAMAASWGLGMGG